MIASPTLASLNPLCLASTDETENSAELRRETKVRGHQAGAMMMVVMHGLFDLVDGVSERDFADAFDEFVDHLKAKQLAVGRKVMRRLLHAGYDARAPRTAYLVAIEFTDADQAERCWSYIERHEEPVTSLHRLVNVKIRDSAFYLLEDVS